MQRYILKVNKEDSDKRLDVYLYQWFKKQDLGFSRTHIQKLIQDENVKIETIAKLKSHHKVKTGDQITVLIEEQKAKTIEAENIPLDVIYEDDDLAIINKPSGMVVHTAVGNYEHTLVNALLCRFKSLSSINTERAGIVHRIDKDTSGLLVIAKNNSTHLALAEQFARHTIKRKYIAIVSGKMRFDENIIELPIARHPLKRENMSVSFNPKSKYAKTYYRTLKRSKDYSVLELLPFTGRTHQLRVHLAYLGHSILGDIKYSNDKSFKRLALHAQYLGFIHPRSKKFVEFSCKIPEEFNRFLK